MRTPLLTSLGLLFASGCEQFYLNGDKDTALDVDEVELSPNPTVDITWTETGIQIDLQNDDGYIFTFGLAESTSECAAEDNYGCWTAEDCISGYISPTGLYSHTVYCHPLEESRTTLKYSESLVKVITKEDPAYIIEKQGNISPQPVEYRVIPGSQTAFPAPNADSSYEFDVTYFLRAVVTNDAFATDVFVLLAKGLISSMN